MPETMKEKIKSVFEKEFSERERKKREDVLLKNFSNEENAQKLIHVLF